MKVRLTPDSLRYRLDQTDTETLSETGLVDFTLSLGAGSGIRCVLEVDEDVQSMEATFSGGEIVVALPPDEAVVAFDR